ncbi:MAG: hypothetical protein Q9227_002501 [Pyrenula ochraceoflavens]
MQVAALLSDLKSLAVCPPSAALDLVTSHRRLPRSHNTPGDHPAKDADADSNADLTRAKDLVDLHYGVKERYREEGVGEELMRAREDVRRVMVGLS